MPERERDPSVECEPRPAVSGARALHAGPDGRDDVVPGRILVVVAHPDDADFGAAGSIARWVGEGAHVAYCIVTDGDAGGFDRDIPRGEMASIRRAEQTAAAAVVGVTEIHFLGYPDGRLEVSTDLRRDIARVIRVVRPERVVAQSPQRNFARIHSSHPDHLAAGEATLSAVYPDARNPFAFPELLAEGLEPHIVDEVLLMASPEPDTFVDVSGTFGAKLAALRAHVSQETDRDGGLEARLRSWHTPAAKAAGMPDGTLAEAFQRVVTA